MAEVLCFTELACEGCPVACLQGKAKVVTGIVSEAIRGSYLTGNSRYQEVALKPLWREAIEYTTALALGNEAPEYIEDILEAAGRHITGKCME